MPYIHQKTSRRHFIRVIAGGTGAIATMGVMSSFAPKSHTIIRTALISDTHISEDKNDHPHDFFPYQNLRKVISEVGSSNVQSAIITGDLARLEGKTGDYTNFKELIDPLAKEMPVALVMGNHDRRDAFFKIFPETTGQRQDISNRFVNILEYPEMRFILLDSLDKCPSHGFLGKSQRDWLSSYLDEHRDKPVILYVHHTFKDFDGDLIDGDRLFKIIEPQKHVKAIIYGHSHSYNFTMHKNIHMINLPATGYNFRPSEPIGWVEASFTTKEGIFKLHAIGGNMENNGKETKVKWR